MPTPTIACPKYYARMYVNESTTHDREKWHKDVKLVELFDKLKKSVLLYADYTHANFHDLHTNIFTRNSADAVRIYFAAFPDDSTDPLVPRGYEGAATFLYAPCKVDASSSYLTDLGIYYLVHPYKGVIDIGLNTAKNWVYDFRGASNILNSLTEIIKKHIPNYPYETDTRSVLHSREDFNDFLTEVDCHNTFTIRAKFSSYHDHETDEDAIKYSCRTIVVYELIDAEGNLINIKEAWRKPHPIVKNKDGENIIEHFTDDFNNAQLCPPNTNCAGGI